MAEDCLRGYLEVLRETGRPLPARGDDGGRARHDIELRSRRHEPQLPALKPREVVERWSGPIFLLLRREGQVTTTFSTRGRAELLVCIPVHAGDLKRPVLRSILRQAASPLMHSSICSDRRQRRTESRRRGNSRIQVRDEGADTPDTNHVPYGRLNPGRAARRLHARHLGHSELRSPRSSSSSSAHQAARFSDPAPPVVPVLYAREPGPFA